MSTHDPVRFVAKNMRVDLRLIAEMIAPGTRVLDIGCGDGMLIRKCTHTIDSKSFYRRMQTILDAETRIFPALSGIRGISF